MSIDCPGHGGGFSDAVRGANVPDVDIEMIKIGHHTFIRPNIYSIRGLDNQLEALRTFDDFVLMVAKGDPQDEELAEYAKNIRQRRIEDAQRGIDRHNREVAEIKGKLQELGPKIEAAKSKFEVTKQDPYAGFSAPDIS